MPPSVASLQVFLIRHGERIDEVEGWVPSSWKDQIDPPLTRRGYEQGQQAFTALYSALQHASSSTSRRNGRKQRIAIFCSPLRRTVGTAMMMANSPCLTDEHNFVWEPSITTTSTTTMSNESDLDSSPTIIPIVIVNELCDCTAAIRQMGGSSTAIQQHLVDCAAAMKNKLNGKSGCNTRLMNALSHMQQTCRRLDSALLTPSKSALVQYWGLLSDEPAAVPMSPPLSPTGWEDITTAKNGVLESTAISLPTNNKNSTCLDLCVRQASRWGCDICIVVTHREEIRDVANHRCGYLEDHSRHYQNASSSQQGRTRLNTPYCCIASFVARLERERRIDWTLHGVVPFERFNALRVPIIENSPPTEIPPGTSTTIQVSGSVGTTPTVTLCTIECLPIDQSNGKLTSCITLADTVREADFDGSSSSRQWFRFQIYDGKRQVLDFLHQLRNRQQVAVGSASWEHSDGKQCSVAVAIQWIKQAELPCPPPWIRIGLDLSV